MITTRVEAGDPPDVALLAQPTMMWRFADQGSLVPLPPELIDRIQDNYALAWRDLGSYQGQVYSVFHRVYPRSFVWYPKRYFEEMGYEVPGTWDDLIALSDQIVADGGTPWCIGIESGAASGWVGTDWLEDVVLRSAGPEVYDQWWQHEIPFDDERIRDAGRYIERIWFNDEYVLGGQEGILGTNFADASLPMWEEPPACYLHRQGNFIVGLWPEDIQRDLDEYVGVFGLPAIDQRHGIPLLVSGDQVVMFDDRPEVLAYLTYLTMGTSTEPLARAGGALFPHRDQDLDAYPTEVERTMARLVMKASVVRLDASDLMPAEVGAGTFWEGMVNWVEGGSIDRVLAYIDYTWP
jgi:alpha-glucoside transport system substrate-binding protein